MSYDRRNFLKASSIAAATGLAGCSGSSNEETPTQDSTPTSTATPEGQTSTTPQQTGTETPGNEQKPTTVTKFDYGGWLSQTSNYEGKTVDARGQSSVSIDVGIEANGGKFGFGPAAIWVDTGTTVTWKWTGKGGAHNVVAESGGDFKSGSPTADESTTFSQTFSSSGTVTYFCRPHRSMGMRGVIVVGTPSSTDGEPTTSSYSFRKASNDAYWYSLYNMSTNIAMSGNGVMFPHNEKQRKVFKKRVKAIAKNAEVNRPPIKNPNLNMAPFTKGDPHFTQKPSLGGPNKRPDARTLTWDKSASSKVVSPSSLAWTHLKGVTWAKNFQNHFDLLPEKMAPKFRAQVLTTLAQLGVKAALVAGKLRKNDKNMLLVSTFSPGKGTVVDPKPRLRHHSAMLWFMSDLVSLATGGWFGYENPKPLIPAGKIQKMADGLGKTTMNAFGPEKALQAGTTRDVGELLGGVGWYGTHAGSDQLQSKAAEYANGLGARLKENVTDNGKVQNGADNQAATQGIVTQGLLWASQIPGVDHTNTAKETAGYMFDELWDSDAGTFASEKGASTYTITARDAGDITGGINAADAVLGRSDAQSVFAKFFNQTFNRGRLQRAERPPSHNENAEYALPLPPRAGGEYGQAAVYNTEIEYDVQADSWSVTDDMFDTEQALYLANQDIWVGNWGNEFYQGRGVPGQSDTPR